MLSAIKWGARKAFEWLCALHFLDNTTKSHSFQERVENLLLAREVAAEAGNSVSFEKAKALKT